MLFSFSLYFGLSDKTAYLHAYMHTDGNIQYANYQSQQQVIDFLTQNGWAASTYAGWFARGETRTRSYSHLSPSSLSDIGGSETRLAVMRGRTLPTLSFGSSLPVMHAIDANKKSAVFRWFGLRIRCAALMLKNCRVPLESRCPFPDI